MCEQVCAWSAAEPKTRGGWISFPSAGSPTIPHVLNVFVEDWGTSYGSPYMIQPNDTGELTARLCEDGDDLRFHAGCGGSDPLPPIAFVDGVRRGEAALYQYDARTGIIARGVAGAHGCGAVLSCGDERPAYFGVHVSRLVIWGSGLTGDLPENRAGFRWETRSTPESTPDAPLQALQRRMRNAEAKLAETLCHKGYLTVLDGPLSYIRGVDLPIIGYVKTHYHALLAPEHHRRVPDLGPGERTSLFALGHERYSAYLRLAPRGELSGPWSGIVRIEMPASAGLVDAVREADRASFFLPRFAGILHRDPRAPQNLQPIGALESHLRHLLGDPRLAVRAVREAVALRAERRPAQSSLGEGFA